jgi:hypothetical protein
MQQRKNHHFMRAMLQNGWEGSDKKLNIFDKQALFKSLRYFPLYKECSKKTKFNATQLREIDYYIQAKIITNKNFVYKNNADSILFTRLITDKLQKDIDGKGLNVNLHIENPFNELIINQKLEDSHGNLIKNYFALQMARSRYVLMNFYGEERKNNHKIKTLKDYLEFKDKYNKHVSDKFNKYRKNYSNCSLYAATATDMRIASLEPFLFVSLINTFCLNGFKDFFIANKKHVLITDAQIEQFKYIHITICRHNQVFFLYNHDYIIQSEIETIAKIVMQLWNSLQFSMCQDILIIKDDIKAYNFIKDKILDYYDEGFIFSDFRNSNEYFKLTAIENKFENQLRILSDNNRVHQYWNSVLSALNHNLLTKTSVVLHQAFPKNNFDIYFNSNFLDNNIPNEYLIADPANGTINNLPDLKRKEKNIYELFMSEGYSKNIYFKHPKWIINNKISRGKRARFFRDNNIWQMDIDKNFQVDNNGTYMPDENIGKNGGYSFFYTIEEFSSRKRITILLFTKHPQGIAKNIVENIILM